MDTGNYIQPTKFNLLELYQRVFNYIGTPRANLNPQAYIPGNSLIWPDKKQGPTDLLGQPFFMPTKLDGYLLPNEPIIEIVGSKRIIETAIDDADGTFKEGFALDDYGITIRGIAIDDKNPEEYPWDIMRKIRSIYEKRQAIAIDNELTAMFNIEQIAIYDMRLIGEPGAESYQPYELICKSDKVFELELKPEEQ